MPQYKLIRQANGKWTIESVPVFGLGMIRDFPYNAEWAGRLTARMQELKENDYFAPVIIGHNPMWAEGEEKEAAGFLDNIRVELGVQPSESQGLKDIYVGTVYADLIDIGEDAMKDIADLKYPYRSIEVRNEAAEITALALLGGTEPHWKFPRLKVEGFKANPETDGERVALGFRTKENGGMDWMDETDGADLRAGKKQSFKQRMLAWLDRLLADEEDIFDEYKEHNAAKPKQDSGAEPAGAQTYETGTGGKMPKVLTNEEREQFKADYGFYPEEAKAYKEKADQADAFRAQAEQAETDKFSAALTAERVSPAAMTLIGELCGFAANDKKGELRSKIQELVKYAREGKLIVPADDTARKPDIPGVIDFSDNLAVDAAVKEEQRKNPKLSYAEALELVKARPEAASGKAGE